MLISRLRKSIFVSPHTRPFSRLRKCVTCTAKLDNLVECSACGHKQPLDDSLSYFSLISPDHKPSLSISASALRHSYLALIQRCHPDRAVNACDQVVGAAWSAWANRAYACLRDPLCRAQHAFRAICPGTHGTDDETADGMTAAELLDVLEKRESIEDCTDQHHIASTMRENEATVRADLDALSDALERGDCAPARHLLNRLRYWKKLREACEQRLEFIKADAK